MKTPPRRRLFIAVSLTSLAAGSAVAQPSVPEGWACQFCPTESGLSTRWSLGSGYASDKSGKFGDYTGLNDDGFYALAAGEMRHWGAAGSYWELSLADFGLDSRSLVLDGGTPGMYRVSMTYDELPKYWLDDALTPLRGVGAGMLALPADWVTASSTADMPTLGPSLRRFDVSQKRKTLGLGLDWLASGDFDYHIDYRHEERAGTQMMTGSFAVQSAWLPEPIDYVTDEIELSVSGAWPRGTVEFAYLGSNFSDRQSSLAWQNPFTPLADGADSGRLALVPDNSANQLRVAGSYRLGASTQVSAILASGRLEQDDVLSALTVNPNITSTGLPQTSLGGRVDTRRLSLDFSTRPSRSLRLTAHFDRDERDNKTPRAVYDYVLTDLAPGGSRINIPYGFERASADLGADYRLARGVRLKAGLERDVHDRSFQARSRAEEDSLWAEIDFRRLDWLQTTIGVTDRERAGSDYRPVDLGAGPQNPLLRQYHLADRDQRMAQIDFTLIPHERVTLLLRAERSRDTYPASELGLTHGSMRHLSFDTSFALPSGLNAYGSWGREDVEYSQVGSQTFTTADWYADTRDTTNSRSLGFSKTLLDERLRLRLDHSASRSRGVTQVLVGTPTQEFPDFRTDLNALSLGVDYDVSDSLTLRIGYRKERYESADWQIDGLRLSTLMNILTFGAQSPVYDVHLLTVSFTYTPSAGRGDATAQ